VRNIEDEIDEARAKVAHCRIRAERPGSRLEDDFALEKARNRLLTLELKHLKQGQAQRQAPPKGSAGPARRGTGKSVGYEPKRTKHEQTPRTARERAEEAFATLRKPKVDNQEVV